MDTKKLRQKILDLAIRGKLVPQDPNDEPASVLLERIHEEKKRLFKEGKLKKKDLEEKPISKDEKSFVIPESWEWVRVGSIFSMQAGKNVTAADIKAEKSEKYPYQCYGGNGLRGYVEKFNTIGCFPLVGRQGALCGNVNIAEGYFWATEHAVVTNGFGLTEIMWQYYFLTALNLNKLATATAQPGLAVSNVIESLIPLPPYAEQKRIANAVERWFTLIDALESNDGDLLKAIDKAKSKILDLAIHGKLVPQDPNDEPASVLLERIRAEKERLIKEGKIKRSKKSASDDEIEAPFEIPESWEWVRLDDICDIKGGKRIPHGMNFSKVPTEHVYLRVTNMKCHTIIENEIKYIDEEVFQIIKNYTISSDDLYLTIAGTIGDVGEIPFKFSNMNLTENAAKLTNLLCDKQFLMYALLSTAVQNHFSSKFHQVAQPKLSIETASSAIIALPPAIEQKRIVAKIEELFAVLDSIKESLEA